MFNLLIVDDEKYSVMGIAQGIDWTDVPVSGVYEAYSARQAKELMGRIPIDLMISDIEMPGENGIELLDWTRSRYHETETIFLTGHANFDYARQAIHLGSYEYIVKPIDYDELKEIVVKALREIGQKKEAKTYQETYRRYHDQWMKQKPVLVERFWQDLLGQRIASTHEKIEEAIRLYNLPLEPGQRIIPVLISVEQWNKELNTRDEEIMEYAIRNSAEEILLRDGFGTVIQDKGGVNAALLYGGAGDSEGIDALRQRCRELVDACNRYFYCQLSCYIGEETEMTKLPQVYQALLEQEHDNVTETNAVHLMGKTTERIARALPFVPVDDWLVLFEAGNKQELSRRLEETIRTMQERDATADTLDVVATSVKHMLYRAFHRKGLPIYGGAAGRGIPRSVTQLRNWALQAVSEGMEAYHGKAPDNRAVIDKIHQYVAVHLTEELNREEIARHVFLNPAYLSRLYKKETGIALSDYIMQERMERTKSLLMETNRKVSDIAETVGYQNISHFAKVFRKTVGIGPKEFRQKYQK